MKKLVLFLFASVLLTTIGYAQTRGGLTGPKAKNYKSWQDNSEKATVVHQVSKKQMTGPQAKNKHLRKSQGTEEYAVVSSPNRERLTGPKAKNQKLVQPTRSSDMDTVSDEPRQQEKKSRNGAAGNDNR